MEEELRQQNQLIGNSPTRKQSGQLLSLRRVMGLLQIKPSFLDLTFALVVSCLGQQYWHPRGWLAE
jgi:hypothetical protein